MESIIEILAPNMALALSILLLLIVTTIFLLNKTGKRHPLPPGPMGLPIIGNMSMMSQLNHRGLAELAKIYGGLLHLKMGRVHMVAVSTADMAQQVLQAQDSVFANRPATIATSYLTYDRADMAFAHYEPYWRQMRKICVMRVFSRRRAESWASVREEIGTLLKKIGVRVGSPVNLGDMLLGLTKNITYRAAFGSMSQEGQNEFLKILQEFSKLFGAFNVADFVPWLGWFNGQDFSTRLIKARGALDKFIDKVIDDHIQKKSKKNRDGGDEREGEEEEDMVDELMEFYGENGAKSSESFSITKNNIKALIMDVMFGGTETVASAIEWAMAELMKNSEELKKVQQELTHVVGLERRVEESDLEKLTYLKCVVKETLRLHPPIPLLPHETAADAVINGYKVPRGARVMINAWAIGRDGRTWAKPNAFKPSRFLENEAPDFIGSNFDFIPFGSGRRSCPGMQLGLYTFELTVAHLCHNFNWELPQGVKPTELDMNDLFGLTAPRAVQLMATPTYRLKNSTIYSN